jgi:excinuclease ABC subunit B
LVQTIGRAARHVQGRVIMYADRMTDSMRRAIDETNLRREVQRAYNTLHGIEPTSIHKALRDLTDDIVHEEELALAERRGGYSVADLPKTELNKMIQELERQMKQAAQSLEFEKAAQLRDQVVELRRIMVLKEAGADGDMPEWERMRRLDEAGIGYDV